MTDRTDSDLLREYVEQRSNPAFAELVSRHVGVVYRAAVRQLNGDTHAAEDVSQSVFTLLARKAPRLVEHENLLAWLHTTTRFAARDALRAALRRQRYEHESATMTAEPENTSAGWERLQPTIDEALGELSESDREAVLLRFFAQLPFRAIGDRFGLSENSARMRVERALEKLEERLQRRGIVSTGSALATVLITQAADAEVPAQLASSLAAKATSAATGASASPSLVSFMTATKTIAAASVALIIAALGVGGYMLHARNQAETEFANAQAALQEAQTQAERAEGRQRDLDRQLAQLRLELDQALSSAAQAKAQSSATPNSSGDWNPRTEGLAFVARHPELRRALAERSAAILRHQYSPLWRELDLTDEQIQRFIDICGAASWIQMGYGPTGKSIILALGDDNAMAGRDDRLRELLGLSGFQQWQRFNIMKEAQTTVERLANNLAFAENPLTPEQAAALQTTFIAAKQRKNGGVGRINWDIVTVQAGQILLPDQQQALLTLHTAMQNEAQQSESMHYPNVGSAKAIPVTPTRRS